MTGSWIGTDFNLEQGESGPGTWLKNTLIFGRTDAKAEGAILWPPDEKSQLIGKGPDARKD